MNIRGKNDKKAKTHAAAGVCLTVAPPHTTTCLLLEDQIITHSLTQPHTLSVYLLVCGASPGHVIARVHTTDIKLIWSHTCPCNTWISYTYLEKWNKIGDVQVQHHLSNGVSFPLHNKTFSTSQLQYVTQAETPPLYCPPCHPTVTVPVTPGM